MGFLSNMIMGKNNRPDYTPDMLPKNRMELFFDALKSNLFNLVKMNLLYLVFWLPFWIWTGLNFTLLMEYMKQDPQGFILKFISEGTLGAYLIGVVPCIAITGPAKAGLKYITRNWARNEHAWIWSDFWDAFKVNWKQALLLSTINGFAVLAFVFSYYFYSVNGSNPIFLFLQVMLVVLAAMYLMMNLYIWPMMVTYELSFMTLVRNSLVMTIGRLPWTVLFGLIAALPIILAVLTMPIGIYGLLYYFIIGYAFTSFVSCAYTNAAFDRFFNVRIEGAEVDKGLRKEDEEYEWVDIDPDEEE